MHKKAIQTIKKFLLTQQEELIAVPKTQKKRRLKRLADIGLVTAAGISSTAVPLVPFGVMAAKWRAPEELKAKAAIGSTIGTGVGFVPGGLVAGYKFRKEYGKGQVFKKVWPQVTRDVKDTLSGVRQAFRSGASQARIANQKGALKEFRKAISSTGKGVWGALKGGGKWKSIAALGFGIGMVTSGIGGGIGFAHATKGAYKNA